MNSPKIDTIAKTGLSGWLMIGAFACGASTDARPVDLAKGSGQGESASAVASASASPEGQDGSKSASGDKSKGESGGEKKDTPMKKLSQPSGQKSALPPVEIGETEEATLGGKKVTAEVCSLDTSLPVMQNEWFSKSVGEIVPAKDGGLYLVDSDGQIRKYLPSKGEKCELMADKSFGKGGRLEVPGSKDGDSTKLSTDRAGNVFVSSDGRYKLEKNALTKLCEGGYGVFRVNDQGSGGTLGEKLVTLKPDTCDVADFKPKGMGEKDHVDWMAPFGDDLLIGAVVADVHKVGIYDSKGGKKALFGAKGDGDERICSSDTATKCGGGVCVVDSNCRAIRMWKPNGTFVGRIELMGSFSGLSYPWPVALTFTKDVAYMSVSHDAKDKDAGSIGMVVRIRGLN